MWTGISLPEASYYLDECGGGTDVERALQEFEADCAATNGGAPALVAGVPADDLEHEWVVVEGTALAQQHDA